MSRLANKIAVVVGGGSGIGGAIAQRFAAEGAHVYATSRTAVEGVSGASPDPGEGAVRAVHADAGSLADLEQVFAKVRSEEGRIDVLVVNAGISEFATLGGIAEDHFDRIFGLNVRSLVFAAQGAIDLIPAGGTIVLVGSIADVVGTKGYGVYSASKAAVRSFARTCATNSPQGHPRQRRQSRSDRHHDVRRRLGRGPRRAHQAHPARPPWQA